MRAGSASAQIRERPVVSPVPGPAPGRGDLKSEVRAGLLGQGPKKLPSRFLYDEMGTALFEVIGLLPEYGLTRADERILKRNAPAIASALPSPVTLAELGSGSGRKTRWILEALALRGPTVYYPIDISTAALERCRHELGGVPRARTIPIASDYLGGLAEVGTRRSDRDRLLLLFLGSTIGNFDRRESKEFLQEVRGLLRPGDGWLIGTDLVKPVDTMLAAYDDALGVTAAFSRNILLRINRELDADFRLDWFEHQARWDPKERRIEMHLVARRKHEVPIRGLAARVGFQKGESIWTESSYKYEREEPARLGTEAGFDVAGQWVDKEWPFAETLLVAR